MQFDGFVQKPRKQYYPLVERVIEKERLLNTAHVRANGLDLTPLVDSAATAKSVQLLEPADLTFVGKSGDRSGSKNKLRSARRTL